MCKSWCQPFNLSAQHYFDFKGHGSWVEFLAVSCFVFVSLFVCLFVCLFFQLLRWVIILFFKSHKWVRFSCFFVCLFFLQNVQFPHHNLGSGWFFFFFLSRRLIKFFAFFYFCSFVCLYFILFFFLFLFLLPKIPSPLISNGAPLSLFYYTDDGGHYVIDNFELPCNSVKNLIPI